MKFYIPLVIQNYDYQKLFTNLIIWFKPDRKLPASHSGWLLLLLAKYPVVQQRVFDRLGYIESNTELRLQDSDAVHRVGVQ